MVAYEGAQGCGAFKPRSGELVGQQPDSRLGTFEGGWTIDNGAEPHRATFYLTKQQTARPVGHTLTRRRPPNVATNPSLHLPWRMKLRRSLYARPVIV